MAVYNIKKGEKLCIGSDVPLVVDDIMDSSATFCIEVSESILITTEENYWDEKKESLKASMQIPKIPRFTCKSLDLI